MRYFRENKQTMKIENQVCSLEQARKLKDLGIVGESEFAFWLYNNNKLCSTKWFEVEGRMETGLFERNGSDFSAFEPSENYACAFTCAQLWWMLPDSVGESDQRTSAFELFKSPINAIWYCYAEYANGSKVWKRFGGFSQASAIAATLIYLLENNHVTIDEVNQRLAQ